MASRRQPAGPLSSRPRPQPTPRARTPDLPPAPYVRAFPPLQRTAINQHRIPRYGQHHQRQPQLQREDAFKLRSEAEANNAEQTPIPSSRGLFPMRLLHHSPFLNRAQENAGVAHEEDLGVEYPQPLSNHPNPLDAPRQTAQIDTWNLAQLAEQIHNADQAIEDAELADKYPHGLPADYDWCVDPKDRQPEDTQAGRRVLKWLADIETSDTSPDIVDDESADTTPAPDYEDPYASSYQPDRPDIPNDASVFGVIIGGTARLEDEEDDQEQFSHGRENMSARDACDEIYGMLCWMRDTGVKPMGWQREVQVRALEAMQKQAQRPLVQARTYRGKAPVRGNPSRTLNWEELGRSRRDAVAKK